MKELTKEELMKVEGGGWTTVWKVIKVAIKKVDQLGRVYTVWETKKIAERVWKADKPKPGPSPVGCTKRP